MTNLGPIRAKALQNGLKIAIWLGYALSIR